MVMVVVMVFEVHLNTGHSGAVPQRALLVFQINLEYFIDIIIINIVIIIVIIKAISIMTINEVGPACSVCRS